MSYLFCIRRNNIDYLLSNLFSYSLIESKEFSGTSNYPDEFHTWYPVVFNIDEYRHLQKGSYIIVAHTNSNTDYTSFCISKFCLKNSPETIERFKEIVKEDYARGRLVLSKDKKVIVFGADSGAFTYGKFKLYKLNF